MTFDKFLQAFRFSDEWAAMEATVENSRWHREANTATHTQMMLDWYDDKCAHHRTERNQLLTKLAILFHDVGKPAVEEEKHNETRGTWRSYANHEQHSARAFEDFMLRNDGYNMKELGLSPRDVYAIEVMIMYHLPYKYEKHAKRVGLKRTILDAGVPLQLFFDLLRADQNGRISDNGDVEKKEVEDWIAEFETLDATKTNVDMGKTVYLLVGVNRTKMVEFIKRHQDAEVFNTRPAMPASEMTIENEFEEFVESVGGENIVVFGSNASPKARGKYVRVAKKCGYKVVCVVFQSSMSDVPDTEKQMSKYLHLTLPMMGVEADDIIIF